MNANAELTAIRKGLAHVTMKWSRICGRCHQLAWCSATLICARAGNTYHLSFCCMANAISLSRMKRLGTLPQRCCICQLRRLNRIFGGAIRQTARRLHCPFICDATAG